jgi:hypothetical protein
MLATSVKVPALFLLTLLVTFPSLYVFNALVGSSLRITANLRLLVAALAVTLTVLASFGPIVAFFSVSTTSYPFMKLLNVVVFGVAGFLGVMFLLQTLHRMSLVETTSNPLSSAEVPQGDVGRVDVTANPHPSSTNTIEGEITTTEAPSTPVTAAITEPLNSPLDQLPGHLLGTHVKIVFRIWAVVFGLVGAQMGWILRPFIGDPKQPFTWFRPRDSNFFEAVWNAFQNLFG